MEMTNQFSQELLDDLKDPKARLTWEEEGVLGAFALSIEESLESKGLTKTDLAKILGKSAQAISRALQGGQNLSVRTMLEISLALGHTIKVEVKPLEDLAGAIAPSSFFAEGILEGRTGCSNINYPNTCWLNTSRLTAMHQAEDGELKFAGVSNGW